MITASNGAKCYLVEVIAFILRYLKDQLEYHFKKAGSGAAIDSFDWVITVPVKWRSSRGKRLMREAAYLVSLYYCNCLLHVHTVYYHDISGWIMLCRQMYRSLH